MRRGQERREGGGEGEKQGDVCFIINDAQMKTHTRTNTRTHTYAHMVMIDQ